MSISNITMSTVSSYIKACKDLFDYLELHRDEFGLLVVPSRGAEPFIRIAYTYGRWYMDTENTGRPIPLRPIPQLYLPFTADIESRLEIEPNAIRDFWTRVLAAILRGQDSDVALRFYKYLLAGANIVTPAPDDPRFRRDNFLFLDTVVSGRAITDIFNSFERHGLTNCHFILLIDAGGRRLQEPFARKIKEMEYAERATSIYVEDIFTEDQGPSVSGIWTVTFPAIMARLHEMIPELGSAVGAGLYFTEVSKRPDSSNLAITVSNSILSTLFLSALDRPDAPVTEHFLEEWKEHISSKRLQDRAATRDIAVPFISRFPGVSDIDVSSSHVVRGEMRDGKAEDLIRAFLRGDPIRGDSVP